MSKAVMTIHGFLTNTGDFDRLYDYFDGYDEVVACKIPGHNEPKDLTKFTVTDTIDTVVNCYDDLRRRHDNVDVVGFSMGGALATYLGALRKVNKIVLLAPANRYFNVSSPLQAIRFYVRCWKEQYAVTQGNFGQKITASQKAFDPYLKNINASMKVAFKHILPNISPYTFGVFSDLIKLINDEVADHSPISIPTLLLWGKLDELVPQTTVQFAQKHFTNLQTVVFEDIGHAMLLTNKDSEIIPHIVKFLSDGAIDVEVPKRN